MSTCCWCTPGGPTTVKLLKSYASAALSPKDVTAANDDLCFCLECVEEYHKVRDEVPSLHKVLWDWEVTRLINHFEKSMKDDDDEDDVYLVEENRVTPLSSCYNGPNFEKRLRVPLLEILKYPYLLLHEHLSELCVDALCKMEEMNYSYQVVGKHPGIYLLMVHPNETIRRWAILTARNLGKVDRDDYYDIQEVLTSLFKAIELGLFENSDIYSSSGIEKTKLVLLPPHLYDTTNHKNYWLGLCMVLSVLEEQAMDSLLLGPDKQNFMQSIMNAMKKQTDDEINDPFWPILHCFMLILDKLGSKVWGQQVDPIQAFDTIINNASYKKEIESIRRSCQRTKSEPLSDYGDVTITCSQIVYNYNPEKLHKDSRLRTTAFLDYCPNFYEDMQTLTDMFQYDIGQDMRLHHSTFLWFIPFVHSFMDLKDIGVAFNIVVIYHLCSEIKEVLNNAIQPSDKVSEFFIWILVMIVELSLKKKCFDTLCVSSEKWVEVVVKCASLPSMVFPCGAERGLARNGPRSIAKIPSWEPDSVQSACMNLIRILLKEGYQIGQKASPFLDELNLLRRSHEDWKLSPQQMQELQACLIKIIRSLWSKSLNSFSHGESPVSCVTPSSSFRKQDGKSPVHLPQEHLSYQSPRRQDEVFQEGSLPEKKCRSDKELQGDICGEQSHQRNAKFHLGNIKQEPKETLIDEDNKLHSALAGEYMDAHNSGNFHRTLADETSSLNKSSFDQGFQKKGTEDISRQEEKPRIVKANLNHCNDSPASEAKTIAIRTAEKIKTSKTDLTLKLKQFVENRKRGNTLLGPGESEKQKSVKEENQGQEGMKRRMARDSSSPSNWAHCKPALSSNGGFQVEFLSIKSESTDHLAEFKCSFKGGDDSEESSTDDELNVSLVEIREKLVKKKSLVLASRVMEPEIDRDNKVSLAACQESTLSYQNPIQRKVQGAIRSLSEGGSGKLSPTADESSNVIIISDTSSDEEENKVNFGRKSSEENGNVSLQKALDVQEVDLITVSSSPLLYGGCESQCFEFETNEEIYSAWEESQPHKELEADVFPVKAPGSFTSCELEFARQLNEWGYDIDYVRDDVEKAEQEVEQQGRDDKTQQKCPLQDDEEGVHKGSSKYFTAPPVDSRDSSRQSEAVRSSTPSSAAAVSVAPLLAAKESTPHPQKSLAKSKWLNTVQRSPEKRSIKAEKKSPHATQSRSPRPFVVPPKKVHHFPEPTSAVEKLGLKKRARRAADLSQRTQDSLAQLRSYGKTAGELPQKRAKLIQPRRMVIRSKDRQFFRQSRPEKRESVRGEHPGTRVGEREKRAAPKSTSKLAVEHLKDCNYSNHMKKLPAQHSAEDGGSHSIPLSLEKEAFPSPRQDPSKSDPDVQGNSTSSPGNICSSVSEGPRAVTCFLAGSSSIPGHKSGDLTENGSRLKKDINMEDDKGDFFLTQRDPVDMELCSQVETSHPEDVELDVQPTLQDRPQATEKCRHAGCTKKVDEAGFCQSHLVPNPPDHIFAKPCVISRPSTKKIFSSSASSRIASLSKDLENSSTPSAAIKTKSHPGLPPAWKANGSRTKLTLANILRSQNVNNVAQPHNVQNSHANKMTVLCSGTGQEARPSFAQASNTHSQHRDHSIFTKYILKWSYDMFANSKEFGPPSHLLQAIVNPVPIKFQNYDDYFNIFFPLMILNAFEEVAHEWLETQKLKEQKPFYLNLLNFNLDLNKADFTANISQYDLDNQHHPRDDDLVFLIASDKRSYCDEREGESCVARHVGFVTRFSHPSIHDTKKKDQPITCHLSVQTQGNLSRVDKQVKCIVVSSLATTQRKFRALLMLSRSPLAVPILCPSSPYFSPRDLNTESEKSTSYMKDFNESQRRAIESAYAMITQHPSLPKICLIHGPPGTGKSTVIVGLLQRILSQRSGKENPMQRLNAKIKTNRVLVCAPSNAAIDDLMKKIIVEFKKLHEKNALGNCGNINLVRLGQLKSINSEVRKFSLNYQIDHKINKTMLGKDQDLQKKKEDLDLRLDLLSRQRAMVRSEKGEKKQQLDEKISQLSKERQRLASQLKEARGRSQELKASIILGSHIICSTLSTSGGLLLESAFRRLGGDPVSCVIVDEAGQTCEIETLIPLIHGCKKLVLVGDPKQLPPTIKSKKAQDYRYDQSLISRLYKHLKEQDQENSFGKFPVLQLTIQYRMHPEICLFPSKYIYEGILTTDRKTAEDRFSLAWPFQPYLLFDVLDSHEERERDSYSNPQEVKLLTELIKVIKGKKKEIGCRQIGIITPYNAQKRRIQKQLDKEFGENSAGEVDTVDGFQGREKDCIIVTCVRANSPQGSIGFLRSLQRLNVTLTRAKFSLFILGKLKTLMENKDWNELIQDAQRRGNIIQTSRNSYQSSALKILKSRPFAPSGVTAPEREAAEHPGGAKQRGHPSRDAQRSPAPPPTPAGSRTPRESPHGRLPPLAQVKRPQDPRLLRRAELVLKASESGDVQTPSLGLVSTQVLPELLAAWSRSNSMPQPDTPGGTSSHLGPDGEVRVPPLPGKAPHTRAPSQRLPIVTEQLKVWGRRDPATSPEWNKDQDYRRRTLGGSQEKEDLMDTPKRRRTTF